MHALGGLLAAFDTGDGEVDFAGHDFSEELRHRQVREEVGADFVERDDDGGVVLRHEEEQGVHGFASDHADGVHIEIQDRFGGLALLGIELAQPDNGA